MTQIIESQFKELSQEDISVLVQSGIVPPNTPSSQVSVFARFCKEKGLSPFSKEVYLTAYNTRKGIIYSNITGIDGYRKMASRTGEHAGTDDVKFDVQNNGAFFTAAQLKSNNQFPQTATVTIYRIIKGIRVSFSHTAVFAEFNSGKMKWQTMPFQMISKVAESFALRKGFADVLSGLNIKEETTAFRDTQAIEVNTSTPVVSFKGVEITPKEFSELDEVKQSIRSLMKIYKRSDRNALIEEMKTAKNDLNWLKLILSRIGFLLKIDELMMDYTDPDKEEVLIDIEESKTDVEKLNQILEKLNPAS